MLLADGRIAGRIISGLGRRLAEVEQRLADAVLKPVPQRLAAVLCQLVQAAPEAGLLSPRGPEIQLTHEQLADLVGTTRVTTTRLLGDLRDAGVVRLRRGGVVALDRDRLRAAADHSEDRIRSASRTRPRDPPRPARQSGCSGLPRGGVAREAEKPTAAAISSRTPPM